jgi:hypothetical protein
MTVEDKQELELWIQPETWPPPPALLPNGDVDIAAIRQWVARYVFGEADAGEHSQSAMFLEMFKHAARKGFEQLHTDLQDEKNQEAGVCRDGATVQEGRDRRLH